MSEASSPSQPQERSRTKTHPIHLPTREADLHSLGHQPHRAQDADQAEEKVAATASPPSLCHQGPSTRCFLIRPTGVVSNPDYSAAALCARAGGSGCRKLAQKMQISARAWIRVRPVCPYHIGALSPPLSLSLLSLPNGSVPRPRLSQFSGCPLSDQFRRGGWPEWVAWKVRWLCRTK